MPEGMTTAITALQGDMLEVISAGGAAALAVAGAYMLWKNGISIFKGLVRKQCHNKGQGFYPYPFIILGVKKMIYFYSGTPGSGKSLKVSQEVIFKLIKRKTKFNLNRSCI